MPLWMLLIGGFLLLALIGLLCFLLVQMRRKPRTARAVLIEKKVCDYSQVTVGHYGLLNRSDRMAVFSINGRTEGFYCGEVLYEALQDGDEGILTYRADQALSFIKDGCAF